MLILLERVLHVIFEIAFGATDFFQAFAVCTPLSRWCPLMLRLSSVVSEADDEEWGEDEDIVSTSSTEAVPEAIPSTGKKKLYYVNWPAKYFWSQNPQTPQGSLSKKN